MEACAAAFLFEEYSPKGDDLVTGGGRVGVSDLAFLSDLHDIQYLIHIVPTSGN